MAYSRISSFGPDSAQIIAMKNGLIPNRKGSITFTTHAVFASETRISSDSFTGEELLMCDLPGLFGQHYIAFPVRGESMYPEIKEGETIVAKRLETSYCEREDRMKILDDISEEKLYVVRTKQGDAWVKYLKPIKTVKGYIAEIRLISVNPKHDSFDKKVKDVEIYKVVRHIRNTE